MFFHGHSFTGNPISCAAALANMKIFKKKDLSKEWSRIEKINKKRGNDISSTIIKDKRSCGTMYALELSDSCGYTSDIANEVSQYALERGVFLRPLGSIIYVLPPYSITNGELDHTWDVIEDYCKSKEER
jgi:adenosylmethionine-8-amino-7-oxononanoate aminotransferase